MSITKILRSEDSPAKKIAAITKIVKGVRESYGNTEFTVTVPEVPTVSGVLPLSALSNESKVALATSEVEQILQAVIEATKGSEGVNAAKAAEALIATNPVLVNLGAEVDFGSL